MMIRQFKNLQFKLSSQTKNNNHHQHTNDDNLLSTLENETRDIGEWEKNEHSSFIRKSVDNSNCKTKKEIYITVLRSII